MNDDYEAAEPRQLVGVSKEVDVVIPNETRQSRFVNAPVTKLGIWKKNVWLTKSPLRKRRALVKSNIVASSSDVHRFLDSFKSSHKANIRSIRIPRSTEMITPQDFVTALISKRSKINETGNCTEHRTGHDLINITKILLRNLDDSKSKTNVKREKSYPIMEKEESKETRHLYIDESLDNIFPIDLENDSKNWQSKENIAREMEDVFLRGASQALTRYIERQLHPAIKETLMISMGYTISYG